MTEQAEATEVVEQSVEAPTEQATEQPASESLIDNAGGWYLAEGVKGEGEAPEWFDSKRFKSLDQQAKSYRELEKKLGAHTGAPKDGYAVPEGFEAEDELVKQAIERAGKHGINQDAFNDIFELFSASSSVAAEVTIESEMAKLGDNATQRIQTVENFLRNNAGDQFDDIQSMVTTAESVELLEKMVNVLAPQKMPVNDTADSGGGDEWAEIEKLMHVKDDHGRLLRSSDPKYNAKIEKMIADWDAKQA